MGEDLKRASVGKFWFATIPAQLEVAIPPLDKGGAQEIFLPLALNDWLAVPSMMTLAGVLSLCSSSDAFIAATFVAFPAVAKLAFLVFGPMMDLKLLFIYSAVFTKRFVLGLAIGLFILIGLLCVRLSVIGL